MSKKKVVEDIISDLNEKLQREAWKSVETSRYDIRLLNNGQGKISLKLKSREGATYTSSYFLILLRCVNFSVTQK